MRKIALVLLGIAIPVLVVAILPILAMSYSGGAPSGFSGPEQDCSLCHGIADSVNTGTGSVSIDAPAFFVAGSTVQITVHVDNTTPPVGPTPVQGFMLSARDEELNHVGDFDLQGSTEVQFGVGGNPPNDSMWVTHTASSNQGMSWTFAWVAPTEDVPEFVTLYAAGNASDASGIPDPGDQIYTTSHTMELTIVGVETPASASGLVLEAIAPNPLRSATDGYFTLERPAHVRVRLLDARGRIVRELASGARPAGRNQVRISPEGLATGVYFLTVQTAESTVTRPIAIVR